MCIYIKYIIHICVQMIVICNNTLLNIVKMGFLSCMRWCFTIYWQFIDYQFNDKVFPGSSDHKESACSVGGLGLIPGSGRSPGEENPFWYSCLKNSMDRGAYMDRRGLQPMGSERAGHNWVTNTFTFTNDKVTVNRIPL